MALHFMQYNFCRIHKMQRVTPAMAVDVTKKLRTIDDIVALIEAREAPKSDMSDLLIGRRRKLKWRTSTEFLSLDAPKIINSSCSVSLTS